LAEKFPTLFQLSNDKEASLDKMRMWDDHAWCWVFSWNRVLRGRNTGLLAKNVRYSVKGAIGQRNRG